MESNIKFMPNDRELLLHILFDCIPYILLVNETGPEVIKIVLNLAEHKILNAL